MASRVVELPYAGVVLIVHEKYVETVAGVYFPEVCEGPLPDARNGNRPRTSVVTSYRERTKNEHIARRV